MKYKVVYISLRGLTIREEGESEDKEISSTENWLNEMAANNYFLVTSMAITSTYFQFIFKDENA